MSNVTREQVREFLECHPEATPEYAEAMFQREQQWFSLCSSIERIHAYTAAFVRLLQMRLTKNTSGIATGAGGCSLTATNERAHMFYMRRLLSMMTAEEILWCAKFCNPSACLMEESCLPT